jgi:drug/metabolite transporter (DMT)-like permease
MKHTRGTMLILGAAVFWGCSATAAKVLLNTHLDTILIVQTRVSISALLMGGAYLLIDPTLLRVRREDLWRFALLGVGGIAVTNFTYYYVIRESTVATAIIIQYTAPVAVMAWSVVSGEDRVTMLKLLAAAMSLAGCFFAVGGYEKALFTLSPLALLSGIGSVVSYSFLTIYLRRLLRTYSLWTTVFYAILFASLFWLLVNPPWKLLATDLPGSTWGALALLAIFSILVPHSLFVGGMRYLVPSRAMITGTFEVVVAILSAAIVLGERLELLQLFGAALVVGAILVLNARPEEDAASPAFRKFTERDYVTKSTQD